MDGYLGPHRFAEFESALLRTNIAGPICTYNDVLSERILAVLARLAIETIKIQCARQNLGVDIQFAFIQNLSVNAVVTNLKQGYCIGVTTSMVSAILRLFEAVYVTPSFRSIFASTSGDAGSSVPTRESLHSEALDIPKSAMHSLVRLAFIFVISHEMAHIANGHLALIGNSSGGRTLLEVSGDALSADDLLTRQCFEWDADAAAIGASLAQMLLFSGDVNSWFQLVAVFYCAASVWRLFDSQKDGDLWSKCHPPTISRQLCAIAHITGYLDYWIAGGLDKFSALREQFERTRADINALIYKSHAEAKIFIAKYEWFECNGPAGNDFYSKMTLKWESLHPILSLHKIGSHRLAPAVPIY
jgi:hypothetical protein